MAPDTTGSDEAWVFWPRPVLKEGSAALIPATTPPAQLSPVAVGEVGVDSVLFLVVPERPKALLPSSLGRGPPVVRRLLDA